MGAPSSTDLVTHTWNALTECFGPQWTDTFGPTPSDAWRTGLEELTAEQLKRGVMYYLTKAATPRAFLPNLPEFRFRCLGIPDEPVAIALAVQGDTSTEFLAAMVASVPEYDRRTLATKDLQARYRASYARIAERVSAGETPALPAPRNTPRYASPYDALYDMPPQDGSDGQPTHVPDGRAILKGPVQVMFERYHAERLAAEAAAEKPLPEPDPTWLAAEMARKTAPVAHRVTADATIDD